MTAVSRRKQSKAEEQHKRATLALKAYRMRLKGSSWWDIAEECSVTEEAAAFAVDEQMTEAVKLVTEAKQAKLLTLELDRLDAMQNSIWNLAMSGDMQAIDRVLKIIAMRSKLLGLEESTTQNVQIGAVVVSGNTDEYIKALQAYRMGAPLEIGA